MKSSFEIYIEKEYMLGYTEKKKGAVIMRAMHPVKVFSTDNAISAEMAAGLLQKEEIPCYIKDLETGDYLSIYMGYSVFGKEIYVDEEDYERAKRLLDSVTPDKSNVEEDLKVKKVRTPRIAAGFALVIIVVPIIIALINSVWN